MKISVIIPVYNDAEDLRRCLAALKEGSSEPFETIVVDDGSRGDAAEATARAFSCRYVRLSENRGPAAARNRGVEACSGDLLLFTDADCIPMPGWVRAASEAFSRHRERYPRLGAVAGRLDSGGSYVAMAFAYTSYAYAQGGEPRLLDYLNTACAAVSREAFTAVGGFSEDMRVNEDPELALRLVEAGRPVFFDPSVCVFHEHGVTTLGGFLSKEAHWGVLSSSRMDIRHPGRCFGLLPALLRNPFLHFLFLVPMALTSAVKAALAVRQSGRAIWRYLPLIILGKLCFRWGNFTGMLKRGSA